MGSQSRSSLSYTGPGVAHYTKPEIIQLKIALDTPPDEAGQKISAKVLLSVLASTNPFFATILSAISILILIEKIVHYAQIAEKQGPEAAVYEIMKDIATGAIRGYITDVAMESLINDENIDPALRAQIEEIVGIVVREGIDQIEEAFLND
jgi:hypothetical protein